MTALPMENGAGDGRKPIVLLAALAVLLAGSVALVWWLTGAVLASVAMAAGMGALALGGWAIARGSSRAADTVLAPPDWSVTSAAIEALSGDASPGAGAGDVSIAAGIAITDRANRLTCANSAYTGWFEGGQAPLDLPLERASREALTRAAREAWRDGRAAVTLAANGGDGAGWSVAATRAGRGEDHLVWRFVRQGGEDDLDRTVREIQGRLGRQLGAAGVEAAIVLPDGTLAGATPGFAERSTGDPAATMAGQEFVTFLRSDDRGRIYFARDGRRGPPQVLVRVPLGGDGTPGQSPPGADEAPSLMLLIDSGAGIGGGFEGGAGGEETTPQLEALLGALPIGLAMTDRDGRFLFANPPFLRAIGREGQALPTFPSDLVVREDKSAISDAVRRFGRGRAGAGGSGNSGDMAVRLRDAPDDPVSLGLAGVRGLGEAAVLLSLADSTEETKLKRQVAQATKMQAVGQLAGGIAHDFNNVLTAIIGYCDLMLLRHTPGDSDYDDIQQIRANSNRAASMTRHLLAFSRQQTMRPEVLQLPDVISEVSQLLKRLMGEKVSFRIRHDRDLGAVRADPQQLEQVIVNLAVNARDAIHARMERAGPGARAGTLTMATRRVSAKDVRKAGEDIIPVADYTVLIVQDDGGGIPPEHLSKIFEPFFTTKEQGKGTGLGLSTVYGIVKQSGGFIFADNVAGPDGQAEGARFTIYLPVHDGPIAEKAGTRDTDAAPSDWSGGGRILLVEDEDMVRAVAERALSREGYTVTSCADGEEGLAAVANADDGAPAFDLVVSDVVMPVMDGPAMARAIRKVRPDLPFLFMSGYAEEQLRDQIDIDNMHFIAKPFSVAQISHKVGEVLAASRSG